MSQVEAQRHSHAVVQGANPVPFRNGQPPIPHILRPLVVDLDHAFVEAPPDQPDDSPSGLYRNHDDLLAFMRDEHRKGREIILATATEAEPLMPRDFEFADRILKRDGANPFSGAARARRLRGLFPQGFIYAGAARHDIPVWQASDHIVLIGADSALKRRLHTFGRPITVLGDARTIWKAPLGIGIDGISRSKTSRSGVVMAASLCLMIGVASLMLLIR